MVYQESNYNACPAPVCSFVPLLARRNFLGAAQSINNVNPSVTWLHVCITQPNPPRPFQHSFIHSLTDRAHKRAMHINQTTLRDVLSFPMHQLTTQLSKLSLVLDSLFVVVFLRGVRSNEHCNASHEREHERYHGGGSSLLLRRFLRIRTWVLYALHTTGRSPRPHTHTSLCVPVT